MRGFQLHRRRDVTGASGTGVVAQGVIFDDGTVAMRWLTSIASTAIYAGIQDVEAVHGHEGATVVEYLSMSEIVATRVKTGRAALASEMVAYSAPHDPRVAGTVGHRRPGLSALPDPEGNRAERRAAAKQAGRAS